MSFSWLLKMPNNIFVFVCYVLITLVFLSSISGAKHQLFLGTGKPLKLTCQKVLVNLSLALGSTCCSTWNCWTRQETSLLLSGLISLSGQIRGYTCQFCFLVVAWCHICKQHYTWFISNILELRFWRITHYHGIRSWKRLILVQSIQTLLDPNEGFQQSRPEKFYFT